MTISRLRVAAAFALVACAAPLCAQGPTGGTISIEPAATGESGAAVAGEVGDALGAHGFTILTDPGHSAYIAEVVLSRAEVGTGSVKLPKGKSSVAPGIGAGAGGAVIVPLSAPRSQSVPLQRLRLDVRIRRRGSDAVVWRGAAVTVRPFDTRTAEQQVASTLAAAILRYYPSEPRATLSVP